MLLPLLLIVNVSLLQFVDIAYATASDVTCADISLTGYGIASASSTAGGPLDFGAAKAFDNGNGKGGVQGFEADREHFDYTTVFYAEEDALPVTIAYQFPEPTTVCGYAILSVPWIEKALTDSPMVWTFDGSNDGTNWRVLHRVEDQKSWGPLERRRFNLERNAKFTRYRLRVTQVRGRNDGYGNLKRFVGVAEVEVFGLTTQSMKESMQRAESSNDGLMNSETIREGSDSSSSTSQGWPSAEGDSGSSTSNAERDGRGWPASSQSSSLERDISRDAKIFEHDVAVAGEDVADVLEYDDGHAAEAILLMGLTMFVVGFVVIRFKQNQDTHHAQYFRDTGDDSALPLSSRRRVVQRPRPPRGTYDLPGKRDPAHHGEL